MRDTLSPQHRRGAAAAPPLLLGAMPLVFVFVWSTGFIGAKFGLPYIEPFFLLLIRFAFAIPLLLLAALLLGGWRIGWRAALGQAGVGVLLHGFYLSGVFHAIAVGMPAGMVAIIVGLQPVLTALLARAVTGARIGAMQAAGLGLGLAGVAMVVLGSGAGGTGPGTAITAGGVAAALGALMGISVGTVAQKRLGAGVPLLAGTALQYCGAAVMVGGLSLRFETWAVVHHPALYLTMAWLVLGLSLLAILLLMLMIRAGRVARVAAWFYLVPPVTLVQGWLLFGETMGPVSALGALATVAAVWLAIRGEARSAAGAISPAPPPAPASDAPARH